MIGNVIILVIAISIVWYVIKVFKSDLAGKSFHFVTALGLIVILIVSIIIPNIEFIKSPFTKEINGKVIDAVSNKPISGATVIIDWYYYYGEFPMHSSAGSVKQLIITTDASGEFKAAKRLKSLAFNMFPLYSKELGDVNVMALHHDYKYESVIDKTNKMMLVKKSRYSYIDEIVKDYSNLIILADAEARRGQHNAADAIRKVASEQDKIMKKYYGYKER